MPKKDIYHDMVKRALIKDGWTITDDPFTFKIGERVLFADLGAECVIGAEKNLQRIIVEIKSFTGHSLVHWDNMFYIVKDLTKQISIENSIWRLPNQLLKMFF